MKVSFASNAFPPPHQSQMEAQLAFLTMSTERLAEYRRRKKSGNLPMLDMSNNLQQFETQNFLIFVTVLFMFFYRNIGTGSVAQYAFAPGTSPSKDDLLAAFKLSEMCCTHYGNTWNKKTIKICWACFPVVQ